MQIVASSRSLDIIPPPHESFALLRIHSCYSLPTILFSLAFSGMSVNRLISLERQTIVRGEAHSPLQHPPPNLDGHLPFMGVPLPGAFKESDIIYVGRQPILFILPHPRPHTHAPTNTHASALPLPTFVTICTCIPPFPSLAAVLYHSIALPGRWCPSPAPPLGGLCRRVQTIA